MNKKMSKLALTFFVLLIPFMVFSHGPHPDITSSIDKLSKKTDKRFSETSDAVVNLGDRLLQKLDDTNTRTVSTLKKINSASLKASEAMTQANAQIEKSAVSIEAMKYASEQFGDTSIPLRLDRDMSDKDNIQSGLSEALKTKKGIEGYLVEIDSLTPKEYNQNLADQNKEFLKPGSNGERFLSKLYNNNSYISSGKPAEIASLIHHIIKNGKPPVVPKYALLTAEGNIKQGKIRNIVSIQNLIEQMLIKTISKEAVNKSGYSNMSTIKLSIKDRYLNSAKEVVLKSDIAAIRSIYETLSMTNYLLFQMLEENKKQSLLLMLNTAESLNSRLDKIKTELQDKK